VKELVKLHGGSVEAHSAGLNKGSEFIVRLPIVVEQPSSTPAIHAEAEKPKSLFRVLIADDYRDSADSMSMMLKIMGHETRTVYNGEDAVSAAATFRPDVILLDIGMPKLNGNEACRRIRELPWKRQPMMIAQTGWGQVNDRQRSQDAGFDHHLVKPIDIATLLELFASLTISDLR
jgi:CheY-like chemotaxis protein